MPEFSGQAFFAEVLKSTFGNHINILNTTHKSGGCINNALKLHTNEGDYFLKWQVGIPEDMFKKEAAGLATWRKLVL